MNVRRCFVKMNDRIEHTQMRISCLKVLGELPKKLGCDLAYIRATGRIVLIADLENDFVVLLFLTAVADMLVIVLDNPVLAFLLGVVFGESLIEQLVIDLSDVIFDNSDVVFCSGRVNIFTQKLTVIVRQAVFFADTTADCSFFDRDCSFLLNSVGGCGIIKWTFIGDDNMKHIGTQMFETTRLIFRPFIQEDCMDMLENWIANPNVQFEYGEPVYTTVEQVETLLAEYISNYNKLDFYRWAIIEKASNKNIGQIAFCRVYSDCQIAEIEYCIGESFWGNGYASEALSALIDFTFNNTDFEKLEAYHRSENSKSGRVLEKSVMHITDSVERFSRENVLPHGEACYCIEKDEFLML